MLQPAATPHPITDRAYWTSLASKPHLTKWLARADRLAAEAPRFPRIPMASDYLAAKRTNDRARLDDHWREDRGVWSALIVRRCLLGLDESDPDDRLLDWTFAALHLPSWSVSAHLPGFDLPGSRHPTLDLASCEMAAHLAELLEILSPWVRSVSDTLADSIVEEIDRRILRPYLTTDAWWEVPVDDHTNNWTGVCAGSILAACVSLERQGHPRPEQKRKAITSLRRFFVDAFTPAGECDEGVGYWVYGVDFAVIGLSRLEPHELAETMDLDRLALTADYPRRAHLFDNYFYSANDAGPAAAAPTSSVPWLAAATDNPFLAAWSRDYAGGGKWHLSQWLRTFDAPQVFPDAPSLRGAARATPPRFLKDQQATLLQFDTHAGVLSVAMAGGTNAERHNHNDLGHFVVALGNTLLIPDLGAPVYTADFFGPRRYTFLTAASRGHCCPVINDCEQIPGPAAAGQIVTHDPHSGALSLDLTAAYPPESRLRRWCRSLDRAPSGFTLTDTYAFDPSAPSSSPNRVDHVLWLLDEPTVEHPDRVRAGPARFVFSPVPASIEIEPVKPADHAMREFRDRTLHRVTVRYNAGAELTVRTAFSV